MPAPGPEGRAAGGTEGDGSRARGRPAAGRGGRGGRASRKQGARAAGEEAASPGREEPAARTPPGSAVPGPRGAGGAAGGVGGGVAGSAAGSVATSAGGSAGGGTALSPSLSGAQPALQAAGGPAGASASAALPAASPAAPRPSESLPPGPAGGGGGAGTAAAAAAWPGAPSGPPSGPPPAPLGAPPSAPPGALDLSAYLGTGPDTLAAEEVYSSEQVGAITATSLGLDSPSDLGGVERVLSAPPPSCREILRGMFRAVLVRRDRQRRFESRLAQWTRLAAAAVALERPQAGQYDEDSRQAIRAISEKPVLATEPLFRVGLPGPDGAVVRSTDLPRQFQYFLRFPPGVPQRHLLCLDLDETLVSSKQRTRQNAETEDFSITVTLGGKNIPFSVTRRPGLRRFLAALGAMYDICIFTYSIQQYADKVINIIDEQRVVRYRLYRQHCVRVNTEGGKYIIVKDLTRVGRPLSNVLLVDNTKSAGMWQKNNFLYVESFRGDRADVQLGGLMKTLMGLAACKDVYQEIARTREPAGGREAAAARHR